MNIAANFVGSRLQSFVPPANYVHLGAIDSEALGDSLAQARAPACHDDHFPFDGEEIFEFERYVLVSHLGMLLLFCK
jgi:hypothetical protein